MAYNKTQWQDLPNETTPIDASNLNKIEDELEALDKNLLGLGTEISSGANLNDYTTPGTYYCRQATAPSVTNAPITNFSYKLVVDYMASTTSYKQILYVNNTTMPTIFYRERSGASFGEWKQLAYTDVATTSADGLMSSTDKIKLDKIYEVIIASASGSKLYFNFKNGGLLMGGNSQGKQLIVFFDTWGNRTVLTNTDNAYAIAVSGTAPDMTATITKNSSGTFNGLAILV